MIKEIHFLLFRYFFETILSFKGNEPLLAPAKRKTECQIFLFSDRGPLADIGTRPKTHILTSYNIIKQTCSFYLTGNAASVFFPSSGRPSVIEKLISKVPDAF